MMRYDTMLQISANAVRVRHEASILSEKLVTIINIFGDLPGRVETLLTVEDIEFLFARQGKGWTVFTRRPVENKSWEELTAARLTTKLLFIRAIPDFVLAMSEAQGKLLSQLSDGNAKLDILITNMAEAVRQSKLTT